MAEGQVVEVKRYAGAKNHLAAFLIYCVLSACLVWQGASLFNSLSGRGTDPIDSTWFLSWWPYAISHHLNPFFTDIVWYPFGVPMLWVTSVPALAVIGWPLTALLGPVFTYNFYILLAPVLSAWFAYLVHLHITKSFWPALIGGFIFGFSTYELAQNNSALNLSMVFCVPALLLVVLKRLSDELTRRTVMILAAILLTAQFLICLEVFALIFVFGGLAYLFAYLYLGKQRKVLRRLFIDGLATGVVVALALLPFAPIMFHTYHLIEHPSLWPFYFVADPLNLIIPSQNNLFGRFFLSISKKFNGGPQEQDIYLGLPLLLVIYLFWRDARPGRKFLLVCFVTFLLCSFGPILWLGGHYTGLGMPWLLAAKLPLLNAALATRFALFVSLVASIITALWLASLRAWDKRMVLGLIACIMLLPAPHNWVSLPKVPFFEPGQIESLLGKDARILIVPFGIQGPASYWQVQSRFGFVMVGGYLGFPPKPAQSYPAVMELFGDDPSSNFLADFTSYAVKSGAQYVLIGPGASEKITSQLAQLQWAKQAYGNVTLLKVPGP